MAFNGANINEKFDVSANGRRVRFSRDVGNIVMDVDGIETTNLRALGGADTLTVDDLSGTAMTRVNSDLSNGTGGDDGAADNVVVNATNADDVVSVTNGQVSGLAAVVAITGASAANDRLTVNAL